MPVTKSAKKKLRQDIKRRAKNKQLEEALKKLIKNARKNPTAESIRIVAKEADKAAMNHIIHKNKAARIKSVFSKLLPKTEGEKKPIKKPLKKPTKTIKT